LPKSVRRTHVFVSYSHADSEHLVRLRVHLRPFERTRQVEVWADTKIHPGQNWRGEIREAIQRAAVAALLISADFLASDFIVENELPPLLAAAQKEGLRIVPVILKPCAFTDLPELTQFQSINNPMAPLISMSEAEREAVWREVALVMRNALLSEGPALELPEKSSPQIGETQKESHQVDLRSESVPWEVEAHFGEEIKNPRIVQNYSVYCYEHLDSNFFMRRAANLLASVFNRDEILREVQKRLLQAGWEGDGEVELIWLPPFVGAGLEDTYGVCLWHVKQGNNGTSWIASPVPLPFERLAEQNTPRSPAPSKGTASDASRALRDRRR